MGFRGIVVLICTIGAIGTTPTATRCGGAEPDSMQLARLQSRLDDLGSVRIVTRSGTFLATRSTVSSAGITASDLTVRSGFTYKTEHEPRLIPWTEIDAIHAHGNRALKGASIGALVGGAIGFAIGAHQPCHYGFAFAGTSGNCAQRKLTPLLLGIVGGAAIGGIAGNRYERWRPIYP